MLETETILRGVAALALLQLVVVLLLTGKHKQSHQLAACYAVGVLAFVLTSSTHTPALLGDWQPLWVSLCVIKAGCFWLLARSLFGENFELRPVHLVGMAALAAYGLSQQLYLHRISAPSGTEQAAAYGFDLVVLGLVASAVYGAWSGLATDLIEKRRRMRQYFVAAVGGYLALAACVQIYNQLAGVSTPALLVQFNLLLMAVLSLTACASLLRLRGRSWLEPDSLAVPERRANWAQQTLLTAIQQAMEVDKIYRQEKLSIGQLAAHLRTPEYQLRQAINEGLGYRNFNDFLHAYRIAEVSEKLAQAETAQVPVLNLALDVGYASLGPFNRAFKERMGQTPTSYRRQLLNTAAPGRGEQLATET